MAGEILLTRLRDAGKQKQQKTHRANNKSTAMETLKRTTEEIITKMVIARNGAINKTEKKNESKKQQKINVQ